MTQINLLSLQEQKINFFNLIFKKFMWISFVIVILFYGFLEYYFWSRIQNKYDHIACLNQRLMHQKQIFYNVQRQQLKYKTLLQAQQRILPLEQNSKSLWKFLQLLSSSSTANNILSDVLFTSQVGMLTGQSFSASSFEAWMKRLGQVEMMEIKNNPNHFSFYFKIKIHYL